MASRASSVFTIASATVLAGLVAYVVYFDYRRRNDADFRKKLRKEKKRVNKQTVQAGQAGSDFSGSGISADELTAALAKIREEEVPASPEQREQYFMSNVNLGEQLCVQGPMFYVPAALHFFRALRVYPSPVELIVIYQKTMPEPVFKIVMELTNLDVTARVEGYYDAFPPKDMDVSVKPAPQDSLRKILVAEKDFDAGDVIYKEEPVVAVLDADLEGKGLYCSHCLRAIKEECVIRPEDDRLSSAYCSKECQERASVQSQNLLFGLAPVLPAELDNGMGELTKADRDAAQTKFAAYIKDSKKSTSLLVARFVARQVAIETAKMMPIKSGPLAAELPEGGVKDSDYSYYDHMERLRFLDGKASDEETQMLKDVLASALPGLEQSLSSERHATHLGKMAYNVIGVCYDGGRDDKPAPTERPEDQERTRTPHGTSRQIGSGIYMVSSYINHSCAPSAHPTFPSGTSQLALVASRPLKKGEEITMAYVDISEHADETPEQARRRRRMELARGWKFKCECVRCLEEAGGLTASASDETLGVEKDESKVEETIRRAEAGEGPGQRPLSVID